MAKEKPAYLEHADILAETVHTAFRKGAESPASHKAWTAIRDMDDWGRCVEWMLWALDYSGFALVKKGCVKPKAAREAPRERP